MIYATKLTFCLYTRQFDKFNILCLSMSKEVQVSEGGIFWMWEYSTVYYRSNSTVNVGNVNSLGANITSVFKDIGYHLITFR